MRLRYIDLTKGFAIVLMLLGHTMTMVNKVHIWIYSFHMPVFFIICGILIYMKESQNKSNYQIGSLVIRRLYTAGIPYFIFGFLLTGFYSILNILANEPLTFETRLFRLFTFQGIDSLWFLPIYVFADIVMICLGRSTKIFVKGYCRLAVAAISFIIVCLLQSYMTIWYFDIFYKVLLGICFIEVGLIISRFQIVEKLPLWISIVFLVVGYVFAQMNGEVEMSASNIGNAAIYFPCAIVTSIAVMSLMKKIENHKWKILKYLEEYGKNTIVLLVTNNLIIEIIRLLDYKFFGNFMIQLGMIGSIVFTIILLIIEWWIIRISRGPLAPVFGCIKKKRSLRYQSIKEKL